MPNPVRSSNSPPSSPDPQHNRGKSPPSTSNTSENLLSIESGHRTKDSLGDLSCFLIKGAPKAIIRKIFTIFSKVFNLKTKKKPNPNEITDPGSNTITLDSGASPKTIDNLSENYKKSKKTDTGKSSFETDIDRGKLIPNALNKDHEAEENEIRIKERCERLTPSIGSEYLKIIDKKTFKKEIDFAESLKSQGIRTSETKQCTEAQGTICNGWTHEVSDSQTSQTSQTTHRIYRSGAFSTQDRPGPGLSEYYRIKKMKSGSAKIKLENQLMEKWGADSPKTLQKMVEEREHLVIAQALPKIEQAVKDIAKDPEKLKTAIKTNSFLFVEQSLVSSGDKKEGTMLQDMQWVMTHFRENLKIRLTKDEPQNSIEIANKTITLSIQVSENPQISLEKNEINLGVTTLLFAQGINLIQSLSNLFSRKKSYQDQINQENLTILHEYAKKVDLSPPHLSQFQEHFSKNGKNQRRGKDLLGMGHIYELTKNLGGGYGVSCKSGKDRTAMWVARILSDNAIRKGRDPKTQSKQEPMTSLQKKLTDKDSISYLIAGYNNGLEGYAFRKGQESTLPKELRPDPSLLGEGKT